METRQPALDDEEDEACRAHQQAVDAALEQVAYVRWFIEHMIYIGCRAPGGAAEMSDRSILGIQPGTVRSAAA
jgi:hypothetical protein